MACTASFRSVNFGGHLPAIHFIVRLVAHLPLDDNLNLKINKSRALGVFLQVCIANLDLNLTTNEQCGTHFFYSTELFSHFKVALRIYQSPALGDKAEMMLSSLHLGAQFIVPPQNPNENRFHSFLVSLQVFSFTRCEKKLG